MITCILLAGSLWLYDTEKAQYIQVRYITNINYDTTYLVGYKSVVEINGIEVITALQNCPKVNNNDSSPD